MPKKGKGLLTVEEASDEVSEYVRHSTARQKQKKNTEADRDADFYFVACFQSKAQRDAFLKAMKLGVDWSLYLDGRKLAERCGVALPESALPPLLRDDAERMMDDDDEARAR